MHKTKIAWSKSLGQCKVSKIGQKKNNAECALIIAI